MLRAQLRLDEICRVAGVPAQDDLILEGIATLDAPADRCLYFLNGALPAAVGRSLGERRDCAIIAPRGAGIGESLPAWRVLEVEHPRRAIAGVLAFVRDQRRDCAWLSARKVAADAVISPLAHVAGDVDVGAGAVIEPFCTIGPDVEIGAGTIVRTGARLLPRVRIGAHCVIGANTVVGSTGFGFVRDEAGNKLRIPHLGGVVVADHVEIGASAVVQYGTIAPTTIADHAKIDDNVTIGHNTRIERGASITGGVVIGGSVVIGADAWIGINSSIRNGRRVGRRALVGMDVSVQQDIADRGLARAPRSEIRSRASADDDGSAEL